MQKKLKTSRRGKEETRKKEKNKIEKAKAAAMTALAALRPKHEQRAPKKFDETSLSDSESSDSDAIVYEDSSDSKVDDTEGNFEGSTSFCTKCMSLFKGKDKETTIGCDMPYCRRWFHRVCVDIDITGISEKEIAETEFICEFC